MVFRHFTIPRNTERPAKVESRIERAARAQADTTLVAVSRKFSCNSSAMKYQAGQRKFGSRALVSGYLTGRAAGNPLLEGESGARRERKTLEFGI